MNVLLTFLVVIGLLGIIGTREPGLTFIVPLIDRLRQVSLRIVTMPIQSQEIITRDNVSIDVSADDVTWPDFGGCSSPEQGPGPHGVTARPRSPAVGLRRRVPVRVRSRVPFDA